MTEFALSRPEKEGYLLVSIFHGDLEDPEIARYTSWTKDTLGFTATPSMEAEIPENVGTMGDQEGRVLIPADEFTLDVSDGLPRRMFIRVEEVTAGLTAGDAGARKILMVGTIARTIRNFNGKKNTVAFFCTHIKSLIDIPMGLLCSHHCIWRLFGRGCSLQLVDHRQFGQIAAIDGKVVTITADAGITNPSAPGGNNDRFWERGYLEKDGLRIGIHIWNRLADPLMFTLRGVPPDSWLGAGLSSILFVPGCHKTVEDCEGTWDNVQGQGGEGGFMGLGYAMLPYNPIIESGS